MMCFGVRFVLEVRAGKWSETLYVELTKITFKASTDILYCVVTLFQIFNRVPGGYPLGNSLVHDSW